MSLARRDFLKGTAAISGGLVLAVTLPGCSRPEQAATGAPKTVQANAWLKIGTDNRITLLVDRSEMGQGVYTALPMLIAEELGVDLKQVDIEFAPPGEVYINKMLGTQLTGGSTSVRDAWLKLRTAAAQAREMLIAAAAQEWGGSAAGIRAENGMLVSPRGARLSFGEVAEAAAKRPPPQNVKLKDPADFRLIGTGIKRLDSPAKVNGKAGFGIDVTLPGMVYAAVAQPPMIGGKAKSFDATAAKAMPGVQAVVETSSGIAVVADSWWQARKARDALKIQWDAGSSASLNDGQIQRLLQQASAKKGAVARNDGDVDAAIKSAARVVKQDYSLPMLAHATLEPQNCTAHVTADKCLVIGPTQIQIVAQQAAAKASGLPPEKVEIQTTFLGGGFGRRIETDFITQAVEISKAVGKPVKVLWTREDDTAHDTYRPPAFDTATAAFDKDGKLTATKLHLVGPSVTARMFPAVVETQIDPFVLEAATNFPYDVPNVQVDYVQQEVGVDVGYWRSVSHALNCFVVESFMDELAHSSKKDPVEFRMGLLEKQPRYRNVLKLATSEAHYGYPPKGGSHGIALMEGYGTYMAQVAEVSIGPDGKARVHRITCAVDCGQVVNPDIVNAQVEGSIIFGLTAALWGEINVRNGRIQQQNFNHYRLMRMNEAPKIDIFVVNSSEAPGGIGEPAVALVAPAVANAIYAATGRRVRSLPFSRGRLA